VLFRSWGRCVRLGGVRSGELLTGTKAFGPPDRISYGRELLPEVLDLERRKNGAQS